MAAEAELIPEIEVEPWQLWSCGEDMLGEGCVGSSHSLAGRDFWSKTSYAEDISLCYMFVKGFFWTRSSVAQKTQYLLQVGAYPLKEIRFADSKAPV